MEFRRQPQWYKDAVIYEVHVKSFSDSDGSGMGDLRGLISKLDYIRDLGVTAIWILPFYPSPLRDDGYDIADYRTVNPAYGDLETFREFLREAHARGIYVITEIVINHTSDQHPWFQKARRAPAGSPEREFYVWSNTKEKYRQARIIFQDYEPSNWTWDPVAKAYYWHRFYNHQPDLNFDNPKVHDAVLEILDYWLEMGVDGLRLDAIPYLYERDGTSCENLPETHAFLKKLSAHVRSRFEHRMLLAEANQWPDDAAAYFGEGDSCDMAFHFPLMTRLYMALEMEDRFPMVDILQQTPDIPENCQWAIFLRNHDELTLEMVTDEERDYMYRVFAKDRRARINLGIRRRLAPLLGNNRRKIELLNRLLLSLPGTPVIYYGDEIGMGDNIYLGDRDGVRTPMQWNADRNSGFSRAPTQKLYLPVIADSEHHYEAVNVENQEANPASLLWWMRRQIRLRHAHPVFGRGTIRFLEPDNGRVLAFVRESDEEAILVLANLSQHPQATTLDLSDFRGVEPLELAGGVRFPAVGEEPWPVMLGGHDSLWLQLRKSTEEMSGEMRALPDAGEWGSISELFEHGALNARVLEAHVAQAPWFGGKSRLLARVDLHETIFPPPGNPGAALLILRAEYLGAEPEGYSLWVGFVPEADAETLPARALIARARIGGKTGYLCEAQHLPSFRAFLLGLLLRPGMEGDRFGALRVFGHSAADLPRTPGRISTQLVESDPEEFRILLRGRIFLRWFRRLHEGVHPDLETLGALKARFPKAKAPVRLAHAELETARRGEPLVLGYAQRFVQAERSALDLATEGLRHFLDGAATLLHQPAPPRNGLIPPRLDFQTLPPELQDSLGGGWAAFVHLLGRRLGELHRALSRCGVGDPGFTPEPFTSLHQHSMYHSIRGRLRRAIARLEKNLDGVPEVLHARARAALERQDRVFSKLRRLIAGRLEGRRIRTHGDLRLDRILFTGKDFVFTSFDGPPWLAFAERRFRFSPLQDVAAVIREIEACPSLLLPDAGGELESAMRERAWAEHWADLSAGLFLDGYLDEIGGDPLLPASSEGVAILLEAFALERIAHDFHSASSYPLKLAPALDAFLRATAPSPSTPLLPRP